MNKLQVAELRAGKVAVLVHDERDAPRRGHFTVSRKQSGTNRKFPYEDNSELPLEIHRAYAWREAITYAGEMLVFWANDPPWPGSASV